jgi:hypothetical protein
MRAILRLAGVLLVTIVVIGFGTTAQAEVTKSCCAWDRDYPGYSSWVCDWWCYDYSTIRLSAFCAEDRLTCICNGGPEWLAVSCYATQPD